MRERTCSGITTVDFMREPDILYELFINVLFT